MIGGGHLVQNGRLEEEAALESGHSGALSALQDLRAFLDGTRHHGLILFQLSLGCHRANLRLGQQRAAHFDRFGALHQQRNDFIVDADVDVAREPAIQVCPAA